MNIREAVQRIAEEVSRTRGTSGTTTSVVRNMFDSLSLSNQDIKMLAADGLAQKVNALLTSGAFESTRSAAPPLHIRGLVWEPTEAAIAAGHSRPTSTPPPPINIDVRILSSTEFEVHGVRKRIIDFTIRDIDYKLNQYGAEIAGYSARAEVFEYAKSRLKALNKTRISDLAAGEQAILARKWKATTKLAFRDAVA